MLDSHRVATVNPRHVNQRQCVRMSTERDSLSLGADFAHATVPSELLTKKQSGNMHMGANNNILPIEKSKLKPGAWTRGVIVRPSPFFSLQSSPPASGSKAADISDVQVDQVDL